MGLIGKIALIGIVSVAVLIAVIWDWKNENRRENGRTTNARQIEDNLPENITTEETLNPETPQDQTPPVTGRPQEPEQQAREAGPDTPAPPEDQTGPPEQEPEPGPPQPAAAGENTLSRKMIHFPELPGNSTATRNSGLPFMLPTSTQSPTRKFSRSVPRL